MKGHRWTAFLFLGLTVLLLTLALAATASGQENNLLANPSFEGGSHSTSLSSWVGDGWTPWFVQGNRQGFNHEPEFGILTGREGQSHEGWRAQRWFNNYATHDAGIMQRVAVSPGSNVKFSIWALSWSAQQDQFGISEGKYRKWVGIDPTGGTDPMSPQVVWSPVNEVMDQWVKLEIETSAKGSAVTAFVRGQPEWPLKHNNNIVDDAVLTQEAVATPTPSGPTPTPPAVEGDSWTFRETNHTVAGAWLDWYRANGDTDNAGYPLSEVIQDPLTGQMVQYFQRLVLEWHPENQTDQRLQRRLLGDIIYPGADPVVDEKDAPPGPSQYFPLSPDKPTGLGHFVANSTRTGQQIYFKDFFDRQGGVAAFGFPKEEPKLRNGFWTQRFQAAVFAYHPEMDIDGNVPGTSVPYRNFRVMLELLGDKYIEINKLPFK